jgi:DNA helicase II / ATP-dependent DNA helicase PcrA
MDTSIDYSDEQKKIIQHDISKHARILAGPGTGKSATLIALLEQIIEKYPSHRTRLLTFTRAATGELIKKVINRPAQTADRPSTIHSFAISVLLANKGSADFPMPLRIADKWEYKNIVRPSLVRISGTTPKVIKNMVAEMSANWQSLREDKKTDIKAEDRSRFMGAWDIDRHVYGYTLLDELPFALRSALKNHSDLKGIDYQSLIVDEYQDLNACDLDILKILSLKGCSIIAAGDDDQSIYSFRKADPTGIVEFDRWYEEFTPYTLSVTRRCPKQIVNWANHVIGGDIDRDKNKTLLRASEKAIEGEVALLNFKGQTSEARGIASLVCKLITIEKIEPKEIVILLKSDDKGRFSKDIKAELEKEKIAFASPDAVDEILADQANRQAFEYFRLLCNINDHLAWSSLIHTTSGIGEVFIKRIYDLAKQERKGFSEVLLDHHKKSFSEFENGKSKTLALNLISGVHQWVSGIVLPEKYRTWGQWIIDQSGKGIVPNLSDSFKELLSSIDKIDRTEISLSQYLNEIQPLGKDIMSSLNNGVRIMSMASAKGLTVKAAILAAVEDGILPDDNPIEERRLLYVAMTRATDFLFCTWAGFRRGPTAWSGAASSDLRSVSPFLKGGPVESQDGEQFIKKRWNKRAKVSSES